MSVCLSVLLSAIYQRGSQWTEIDEVWYWRLLRKYVKLQSCLQSNKKHQALHNKTSVRLIADGDTLLATNAVLFKT